MSISVQLIVIEMGTTRNQQPNTDELRGEKGAYLVACARFTEQVECIIHESIHTGVDVDDGQQRGAHGSKSWHGGWKCRCYRISGLWRPFPRDAGGTREEPARQHREQGRPRPRPRHGATPAGGGSDCSRARGRGRQGCGWSRRGGGRRGGATGRRAGRGVGGGWYASISVSLDNCSPPSAAFVKLRHRRQA